MITFVGAGSSTITANQAATVNYTSATTTATCTVNPATPTVIFPDITVTYGDAPINPIVYSSDSDGAVTYTSSDTSVATINGDMITFVGAGSSTITANQSATTNYTTGFTTAACTVNKAVPTTYFSNIEAIYGDVQINLTGYYNSNSDGAVTYTSSDTSIARITDIFMNFVGVGSSTITATQAETINYTSAITPAVCTVGGNTPANPVIITTDEQLVAFLNEPSRYAAISDDITLSNVLLVYNDKTITSSTGIIMTIAAT